MSQFKVFADLVHTAYNKMAEGELFTTNNADIFATYIDAFPEGTNPTYRVRTEHDCNCCKNFIRRLGGLIAYDADLNPMTVWDDWASLPEPYQTVAKTMQEAVLTGKITGIFRSKERAYGAEKTSDNHEDILWFHFYGKVHDRHYSTNPGEAIGRYNNNIGVLRRALEGSSLSAVDLVIDMIQNKQLYRGEEFLDSVKEFRGALRLFLNLPVGKDDSFIWANGNSRSATFRNSVIGTLVTDLSDGVDMEKAVGMFEAKVAPTNYKRSSSIITPKMIETAVGTLKMLNLEGSTTRRVALSSDVSVKDVIWADRTRGLGMKDALVELLVPAAVTNTLPAGRNLDKLPNITIDQLISEKLPKASAFEILMTNGLTGNLVALTTSDAPGKLFHWDNPFSWSYKGDVTDSIKEKVKRAGGNTDAPLRVSLLWHNSDDLDLHATCPGVVGEVYYHNKQGILDVDTNGLGPKNSVDPVENLSWKNPRDGKYTVDVHMYARRNSDDKGLTLEVYDGTTQQYDFNTPLLQGKTLKAFNFTVKGGKIVQLEVGPGLVHSTGSQRVWGIETETFVPVNMAMLSPNHWAESGNRGNKHFMFMLDGCSNPDPTRGIYNEYLRSDLNAHRKVFEILGSKTKAEPDPKGLAGLGFSSTVPVTFTVALTVNGKRNLFNVNI